MSAAPTSRWIRAEATLTERERAFILGSEGGSGIEGRLDLQRYLNNLAADQRRIAREQPKPFDAIPRAMCARCGMVGQHATPAACIEALRDRLASWE